MIGKCNTGVGKSGGLYVWEKCAIGYENGAEKIGVALANDGTSVDIYVKENLCVKEDGTVGVQGEPYSTVEIVNIMEASFVGGMTPVKYCVGVDGSVYYSPVSNIEGSVDNCTAKPVSAVKGTFIEYTTNNNENKYPEDGIQGGYYYEIVEDVTSEVTAQTPIITQIAENLGVTVMTPSGTNKQILQGNNVNLQTININFAGTQEKTVTPTAAGLEVIPDEGYLLNKVIIDGDSDLVAENIKRGINIFGVDGAITAVEFTEDGLGTFYEKSDTLVPMNVYKIKPECEEISGQSPVVSTIKQSTLSIPVASADYEGNFYYIGNGKLEKLDSDGNIVWSLSNGTYYDFRLEGNYIWAISSNGLLKLSTNGNILQSTQFQKPANSIKHISDFYVYIGGKSGDYYYLTKYDKNGVYVSTLPTSSNDFYLCSDDYYYYYDGYRTNYYVYAYTMSGTEVWTCYFNRSVYGLQAINGGAIAFTGSDINKVAGGEVVWSKSFDWSYSCSVVEDSNGYLYAVSNGKVVKLLPDGTTVWSISTPSTYLRRLCLGEDMNIYATVYNSGVGQGFYQIKNNVKLFKIAYCEEITS